jgi:hypothetical protein
MRRAHPPWARRAGALASEIHPEPFRRAHAHGRFTRIDRVGITATPEGPAMSKNATDVLLWCVLGMTSLIAVAGSVAGIAA